jgi:dTDP-4-amino-4,6-dideoxygalactose transaminase
MDHTSGSTLVSDHAVDEALVLSRSHSEGISALLRGAPAFAEPLPFMRPTLPSWDSLAESIHEIIDTGMLTKGHYLEAFEEHVAQYLGVKHAVAVSSCTLGLMLVCQSLALEGEVLVPSFTFMATVHPLVWQGLTPVFVDIDPRTWSVDPDQVESRITSRTTAIVAVHVFGAPAPIEELEAIAKRHGLALIFDAAHGFGALHHNEPLGGNGVAEVFSTSPTKLLVTGEGGIVATNNDDLAYRVKVAREYGNPGNYDSLVPGINARMQEFSAILGLRSLEILEENAQWRNSLVSCYRSYLGEIPGITFQRIPPHDRSSFKDFTIRIDASRFGLDRDGLKLVLEQQGINTRAYYVPPVHQHTAYKGFVRQQQPFLPITECVAQEVLSLPIYSHMHTDSVVRVCDTIQRIYDQRFEIQAALKASESKP